MWKILDRDRKENHQLVVILPLESLSSSQGDTELGGDWALRSLAPSLGHSLSECQGHAPRFRLPPLPLPLTLTVAAGTVSNVRVFFNLVLFSPALLSFPF